MMGASPIFLYASHVLLSFSSNPGVDGFILLSSCIVWTHSMMHLPLVRIPRIVGVLHPCPATIVSEQPTSTCSRSSEVEGQRYGSAQALHKMPPTLRQVQHVTRFQNHVHKLCFQEPLEGTLLGCICSIPLALQYVCWVQRGIVLKVLLAWIEFRGLTWREETKILVAHDLAEDVLVGIPMCRCDRALRAEEHLPQDCASSAKTVVWHHNVILQFGYLVKQRTLCQVASSRESSFLVVGCLDV
mmetsp:Transcript_27672/g.41850  ORF Transcript_27672/g.41850 Transcript_27672/m.41850 type:complete len:243 (+) Transcript_27672:114-842(+)